MSEYLARLSKVSDDTRQWEALERDKSCVVIAGPGSGKTYLLTTKVAKLLFEQVEAPRGVACLTYSRLMARKLETELRGLGVLDRSGLFVGTVHSFCLRKVIQPYRHLYGETQLPDPFRIASEEERIEAFRAAVLEQGIEFERIDLNRWGQRWRDMLRDFTKYRRKHPHYDVRNSAEDRWSGSGLQPQFVATMHRIDWSQLASRYVESLLNNGMPSVDFTQIEIIAMRSIEQHEFVREMLAACYPWWAIDEYQDLGYPFHRMICCLLRQTEMEILAIGDPDQCIYEDIQGTSPDYIWELAELVERRNDSGHIKLECNYRCAQKLVNISERILGRAKGYKSSEQGGECWCLNCKGDGHQEKVILERILPFLTESTDGPQLALDEIAILHLRRAGLNQLSGKLDIIQRWAHSLDKESDYSNTSRVIDWLELCAKWCIWGWESGHPYFYDLAPFWIELNTDPQTGVLIESGLSLEVHLFETLWELRQKNNRILEFRIWFDRLLAELRLQEVMDKYRRICPDDVSEFDKLTSAIETSRRPAAWPLARFAKGPDRIQLTTLHSSKGTQFEAVIIAGAGRIRASEQERRLAYVGFTRAKRMVFVLFNGMPIILSPLRQDCPDGCHFKQVS